LKEAFSRIKEELDSHLETINQNTNEISANYEYMLDLEKKIDKLNERIEELQLAISHLRGEKIRAQDILESNKKDELSTREKEIILLLSSFDALTISEIAKKLGLTDELIRKCISEMVLKGIPLVKFYRGNLLYISMDKKSKGRY
jgi:predicted transcriptional regulator